MKALDLDWKPVLLLLAVLALIALPLVGTFPTWVTLTVAGLAMGHDGVHDGQRPDLDLRPDGRAQFRSRRVRLGRRIHGDAAYMLPMKRRCRLEAESVWMNFSAWWGWPWGWRCWSPALLGWAFERMIIRPVYGLHLKQILITMGGMIVAEQTDPRHLGRRCRSPLQLPDERSAARSSLR
jgi:branched-chain amino acid transport system permease protein